MTKHKVFYSFHYKPDNWRVGQVRNIGVLEGNSPVGDNDWETIQRAGDANIEKWINDQLSNRSCTVVLIGSNTANRKWINYEIVKTWNDKKGLVGIYIHGLKNSDGETNSKGKNPFDYISIRDSNKKLSSLVKCYNPQGANSKERKNWIKENLNNIVTEAKNIRADNYISIVEDST